MCILAAHDLGAVTAEVASVAWFGRLGLPLDEQDRVLASGYARSLGASARVAEVASFAECAALLQQPLANEWATWERLEKALRATLYATAPEPEWARAFTAILDPAAAKTADAAASAFARLHLADPYARYVASGAALHSVHLYLLARVAGERHPFIDRFAIFQNGRWPLALDGKTMWVW